MNNHQKNTLNRTLTALMFIIMVVTLQACDSETHMPIVDEETTCSINGGKWKQWIAEEVEPGYLVARGGRCECEPVVTELGQVCQRYMNEF